MSTLESCARQVVAAIDTDAGYLLAAQWVNNRFAQIATRVRLRSLRGVGLVTVPAPIIAGTATFTRDSVYVTGDATATAAWTTDLANGFWIRTRNVWYEILDLEVIAGVGRLTLAAPFGEDSIAGAYTIYQRFVPLRSDVQSLGKSFLNLRRRTPIDYRTMEEVNLMDPSRRFVRGWGPIVCCEAPLSPAGVRRVEFYPEPNTSETYGYMYWRKPTELALTDELPYFIPSYVLREGALIDLYRFMASKAANKGQVEVAGYWRNEARAQETKWDADHWREAVMSDRAEDESTFILKHAGIEFNTYDITNAKDDILARWTGLP